MKCVYIYPHLLGFSVTFQFGDISLRFRVIEEFGVREHMVLCFGICICIIIWDIISRMDVDLAYDSNMYLRSIKFGPCM